MFESLWMVAVEVFDGVYSVLHLLVTAGRGL
jgi:hypothetical protein